MKKRNLTEMWNRDGDAAAEAVLVAVERGRSRPSVSRITLRNNGSDFVGLVAEVILASSAQRTLRKLFRVAAERERVFLIEGAPSARARPPRSLIGVLVLQDRLSSVRPKRTLIQV